MGQIFYGGEIEPFDKSINAIMDFIDHASDPPKYPNACCLDRRTGLPVHNRLDLKQTSLEYSSVECGAINQVTGKPDYCCFNCQTIREKILRGEKI